MYQLIDDFRACDENRQPYSFRVERHTETANLHAWVRDERFHLSSVGNRHVLNVPAFRRGTFEMAFRFTYMEEFDPGFTVFIRYDPAGRKGQALRFTYSREGRVTVSMLEADRTSMTPLSVARLALPRPLAENQPYPFRLDISDARVEGSFAGAEFSFPCGEGRGKLAIQRGSFIGEMILDRVCFASEDEFPRETLIPEVTAEVPCVNGGDIPYTIAWRAERIGGEAFLFARLDGGTRTRAVDREDRPGQYVVEKDWMTEPYVGLTDGVRRAVFPLARGEKCFVDPNIFWDCQKGFFGDTALPLEIACPLPERLLGGETRVLFGYERLQCTGYFSQAGGCEYRYTPGGRLLDYGPPADGRDMYELFSQPDKLAMTFVPEDCWNRQAVLDHLRYNHYFDVSEDIDFTLEMKTRVDPDYLSARAAVLDVYESRVIGEHAVETERDAWDYGYRLLRFHAHVPHMPLGVWKIEFRVFFGEELYKRFVKVFEVLDRESDQNPALASGLPFTFSMPNEQKWLQRNSFDFWNPARSCDIEHYITCITETPVEAELRKSWRMLKPFRREWFAWLSSRTCKNWRVKDHPEVAAHADYLFASWEERTMDLSQSGLYPVRQDHFNYPNFMMRERVRVEILNAFLKENPDIAGQISYHSGMKFTFGCFRELMELCASRWIEYQNRRGMEILRAYNEELKRCNPGFRRALYGPINVYVAPTQTAHALRAFGFSSGEEMVRDCFTGFCVFEDYPFSCAYPTSRGAFMVMQILLEAPGLVLYPEQYKGSRGGCIDGAVKFAHAPMGAYTIEPYENSTHAFEFVFNTAHLRPDGFHYWNTYGFHRSDYTEAFMDRLVRDWRYVVENKPARPLRGMAFLAEYTDREDEFTVFRESDDIFGAYIINRSDVGHGLIHDCSREAGLPNGFALKYDALPNLTAEDCDLLVLPDLADAGVPQRERIRALYESGVNLVAVSRVDGLEDLFGVERADARAEVTSVLYDGEREYVRGLPATLPYRPAGAEVVMEGGNGEPLALRTDRTLLLNAPVTSLGCADAPATTHSSAPHIVGRQVRRMLRDALLALSRPLALGEPPVAVTLFETLDGRRELLVIDYTPFDNREHGVHPAVVRLDMPGVTGAHSERPLWIGRKDGIVRELRFHIAPRESVFIELLADGTDAAAGAHRNPPSFPGE